MPENRTLVVITYDISDDRRRTQIGERILGYGGRIQGSVYECWLTRREIETLWHGLRELVRPGDRLRYYLLCEMDVKRIRSVGLPDPQREEAFIV